MSYGMTLKVRNGFISLESSSGAIPDGSFEISGHEDEQTANLAISRREPDGTFAGSAGHTHRIPRPADPAGDPDKGF